jgi:hypothetical protein
LLWADPMELLGDIGQVEDHFHLFGDSVNHGPRLVHGLCESAIGSEIILGAPSRTSR